MIKIYLAIAILSTCLLNVSMAHATTGLPVSSHWENAFYGGDGAFPIILADREIQNKIYAMSDVSGMHMSTDKGANWGWLNNGTTTVLNNSFAQSEYNPDIMYMAGVTIVKSANRGNTWTEVATFNSGASSKGFKIIAIDRNNPNIVYIGISDGTIRKTINGGSTWTTFATPFGVNVKPNFLYINKDSTFLIVGSQSSGMIRYDLNVGTSAAITLSGTNALYNWDYSVYTKDGIEHICVGGGFHISCSDDNGTSWTNTADVTADSTFFVAKLTTRLLANGHVRMLMWARKTDTPYGETLGKVSDDDGSTWTDFWSNITFDFVNNPLNVIAFSNLGAIFCISSDPFDENIFYIGTLGTIFRSDDGGKNWTEKIKGAQNTVLSDVTVSANGTIFTSGMDVGVAYSTNNGDTWTQALPHISNGNAQGFALAGHYWRIITTGTKAQWDAGTGHVIVTASPYISPRTQIPTVFRSTDNGVTWTESNTGLPTTLLDSSGGPNQAEWGIGIPRGLAKSINGNIIYLTIDGYSATENGGIFKSTDNGVTWARTTQPAGWRVYNGISVDPTDATGNTVAFAEWFGNAGHSPQYFKSTDGGATWSANGNVNYGINDITYNSVGNLFAAGLYTGPEAYYSSNGDNGTWNYMKTLNTTTNLGDGIYSDPADPQRLFVGVNDGTNTGPGTGSRIGGSIYMTTNALSFGNATWTEITGDIPSPAGVSAIAINPFAGSKGYLFAAIDGAGLFRLNLDDFAPTNISNVGIGN